MIMQLDDLKKVTCFYSLYIKINNKLFKHDGSIETWKWFHENKDEYLKRKNYFI